MLSPNGEEEGLLGSASANTVEGEGSFGLDDLDLEPGCNPRALFFSLARDAFREVKDTLKKELDGIKSSMKLVSKEVAEEVTDEVKKEVNKSFAGIREEVTNFALCSKKHAEQFDGVNKGFAEIREVVTKRDKKLDEHITFCNEQTKRHSAEISTRLDAIEMNLEALKKSL